MRGGRKSAWTLRGPPFETTPDRTLGDTIAWCPLREYDRSHPGPSNAGLEHEVVRRQEVGASLGILPVGPQVDDERALDPEHRIRIEVGVAFDEQLGHEPAEDLRGDDEVG